MATKRKAAIQNKQKTTNARGNSRSAQNKAIRREALREELQAREYLRQITTIAGRLDPETKNAYDLNHVPMVKERINIYFRLLDKCLPNLRPVDTPIEPMYLGESLAEQGAAIIKAMSQGYLTPSEATSLMQAVGTQARIIEVDELEKRLTALERANEHTKSASKA